VISVTLLPISSLLLAPISSGRTFPTGKAGPTTSRQPHSTQYPGAHTQPRAVEVHAPGTQIAFDWKEWTKPCPW
jgi:hypothetical protein